MMTEEPARASVQQNLPPTEKASDLNDKKFKGPRRILRKKRFSRENEFIDFNQPKLVNDDRVFYRSAQEKSSPPLQMQLQFQIPQQQQQSFQQLQLQQLQQFHFQPQQFQAQPQSPQITPPLSTSHPLSSYRTPSSSNPPANANQFMMGPPQFPFPMPMPMQMPMPIPMTIPMPMNFNGTQVPIQMPLQIPLHMAMSMPAQMPMHLPNFPLPVFIRLPIPFGTDMNYLNENFKQICDVNGSSEIAEHMADPGSICMPNYMPQMFPHQLGPILIGLPQSMVYPRPDSGSPFHIAQPLAK